MLLDFPLEIRLRIFYYLFEGTTFRALRLPVSAPPAAPASSHDTAVQTKVGNTTAPTQINHNTTPKTQTQTQTQPTNNNDNLTPFLPSRANFPHILTVSRQLFHETHPIFHTTAHFHLQYYDHSSSPFLSNSNFNSAPPPPPPRWPLSSLLASFPRNSTSVRSIRYTGTDPLVLTTLCAPTTPFPRLELLEFDLAWDHHPSDQTNWDRAVKYALRDRGWRRAVEDALRERMGEDVRGALKRLREDLKGRERKRERERERDCGVGVYDQQQHRKSNFRVLLLWQLGYRFVEFVGECDLVEWVLRVRDPDGVSANVYEVRQDEME